MISKQRHQRWKVVGSFGALLAVGLVLTVANGCGNGDGALAASSPFSPRAFADDSFAEIATNGEGDLWMAVAGFDRRSHFGVRVFQKSPADWRSFPTPPERVSGDSPISIAIARLDGSDSEPCLGYTAEPSGSPYVTCWSGSAWNHHPVQGLQDAALLQIASDSTGLLALFLDQPTSENATYRVLHLGASGWTDEGPPIAAPSAVARLGAYTHNASGRLPTIGVTAQSTQAARYVLRLENDKWQKLGRVIHDSGMGPMIGGAVITNGGLLFPINDAKESPWAFSVEPVPFESIGAQPKTEELSTGAGDAQGRVDSVGREVWASWQEDKPLPSGGFRVGIFAAKLDGNGSIDKKVVLWRGRSIGPGSTQIVEFRGRRFALYMPSSMNGKGLRTVVRPLPERSR